MREQVAERISEDANDEESVPRWFSTKVRLVCLIEPEGADEYMDSVFLFLAVNYSDAVRRAIELGRALETDYMNANSQCVMWRLKEVISLDMIKKESLNGAQVYSEFVGLAPEERIPFGAQFHPEQSQPKETLG